MNNGYPSDLNDNEWELIEHFFERPDPRGNKGYHSKRTIVNGIFFPCYPFKMEYRVQTL